MTNKEICHAVTRLHMAGHDLADTLIGQIRWQDIATDSRYAMLSAVKWAVITGAIDAERIKGWNAKK